MGLVYYGRMILRRRKVDEVDTVMDDIQEQMDIAATISDAIAQPIGSQMDEVFALW